MRLEYQIIIAVVLDYILGDPRWLPHPVKMIGRFALFMETPLRKIFRNSYMAGVSAVLIVLGATGISVYAVIRGAAWVHPVAADILSIILLYTTLAARDLTNHSMDVYHRLQAGDLPEARKRVSLLVGRDTDHLDERDVVRATLESVAENTVDGVMSPLFFAVLGGPLGAILYKAVNTLDSTFGYKNDRYREFGWASARLDDLANFIPARLTSFLLPVAAAVLRLRPMDSLRILIRDGQKHPSPNSGLAEAAVAGALGVQLGGLNYYFGRPSPRPTMGDPLREITKDDIPRTNRMMYVTLILSIILFLGVRMILIDHL